MSYNRLVELDAGTFSAFPKLSYLVLSHNYHLTLERNGRTFEGIEDSIVHLELDNISLSYVRIFEFTVLLIFSIVELFQIPPFPLPNLLSLSLAYNSLPTVPPEIASNISSLRKLNLDYNDLTAVPIVTHSLTQLRHLSLAGNPITVLSNTSLLGVAEHLAELDIRDFELNTFEVSKR